MNEIAFVPYMLRLFHSRITEHHLEVRKAEKILKTARAANGDEFARNIYIERYVNPKAS